ncbi:MAG: class C sortase, partial [Eubacteriales bacterium]|nr:class C sortase [Eubacteriales bacterium]
GLSILLYPTISNKWNEYRAKQLISSYSSTVTESSDPEEYRRQKEEAAAYNGTIMQETLPDAFSIRDGIQDPRYEALLNMDQEGLMGSLEIPAIGETLPIYHYTSQESLERGVGHLFGSSLPVGGEGSHTVLSAHRGLPSAKLFTDLPLLEMGDVFYIHILGDTLAYRVDQMKTVEPDVVEDLEIEEGKDYATLMTCTPYGVNTHRLLVRGHRVDFVEETYVMEQERTPKKDTYQMGMQLLCAAGGVLLAVLIVWAITLYDQLRRKRAENQKIRCGQRGI